jgi:predicted RNA-binding Zn ribbon-like protein
MSPGQAHHAGTVTWPASERYHLCAAPDGLAAVQDLLNTRPTDGGRTPDLLASVHSAQSWADTATGSWAVATRSPASGTTLTEPDLPTLRCLRNEVVDLVRDRTAAPVHSAPVRTPATPRVLSGVSLTTRLSRSDEVRLAATGPGWHTIAGIIAIEIITAEHRGIWCRLKTCRNVRCPGCFYDRSPNNSGVWHDVRTCGNVANLRASRARRRAAS